MNLAIGTFHKMLSDTVNVHRTIVGRAIHPFLGAIDQIGNQLIRFHAGDLYL